MARYYVNNRKDNNGNNEVHKYGCHWLNEASDVSYLGTFNNGIEAVNYARYLGYHADGCYYCCREAHNG